MADPELLSARGALAQQTGKPPRRTPSLLRQIHQCLSVAGLALLSYFLVSHFFLQSVKVVGRSMVPTLQDSQQYLLNRWVYHFRAPQRTDVVVIRDPTDQGFSVKRIIGVAGDSILLKGGEVFVNGRKLAEPYLAPNMSTYAFGKTGDQLIVCGKDQYFVLGDNRMNSADSRTYGPIPRQSILGLIVR